jgi:isopentenyl-diphosphate delta-isomerase
MPKKTSPTSARKADHIRINLTEDVRSGRSTGLENYSFPHQALPELDLNEVSLKGSLFGKKFFAPLLISSMTGGTSEAGQINRVLAEAAQEAGILMGVGSQRAALEDESLAGSFQVRKAAPDIHLFANLGAVQLNYGRTAADCQRAVEMIEADALILHLNPLQEAVMAEGNTNFAKLIDKIEKVCQTLTVPVIAKEVGWGISKEATQMLVEAGISAFDVAGAGGTSWTEVEMHRAETETQRQVASSFGNWGIPTAESIQIVRETAPQLPIIASGGIRNGVEIAKSIALGASLAGMAGPFLKAAAQSPEAVLQVIDRITTEIRIAMFASGARNLKALREIQLSKG